MHLESSLSRQSLPLFVIAIMLLLTPMQMAWADASHEAQDTIFGEEIGDIALPSGVAIAKDSEFSIPIEIRVKGEIEFESADDSQVLELPELTGETFQTTQQLSLNAQSYQVTEHYTLSVVSLSSFVPGSESWDLTFIWPEAYEAAGDIQQFTSELHLTQLVAEVSGDLTGGSSIIDGQLAITFIATKDLEPGANIHYSIAYSGDYTKTSTLTNDSVPPPPGDETQGGDTGSGNEETPPGDETPPGNEETPPGDETPTDTPDEGDSTGIVLDGNKLSIRESSGQLLFEDILLTMELPDLSDEPIEVVATLDGTWFGKGTLVVTPSGVLNHQIQIEDFEGKLSVAYNLDLGEQVPNPLVVALVAAEGHLKQHGKDIDSDPSLLDLFVKARTIQVLDPDLGQELPWPTDILGPMPNMLKIRDGELQFLKSTGNGNDNGDGSPDTEQEDETTDTQDDVDEAVVNANQEAEGALLEAQQARDDAESEVHGSQSASVKEVQRAARRATSATKRAQQAAEKAQREADKASAKSNGNGKNKGKQQEMIQATEEAAQQAMSAAQEAEEFAKDLGRRASDLNQDGSNDILDLVRLGLFFGEQSPDGSDVLEGDVNGDGNIDIFDIVLVARTLGGGGVLIWLPTNEETQAAPAIVETSPVRMWLHAKEPELGMPEGYIQIEVMLDTPQPIQGVQYDLALDTNLFSAVSVEPDYHSAQASDTVYWHEPQLNAERGRLEGTVVISLDTDRTTGMKSGRLATVTLKFDGALRNASANALYLADIVAISPEGESVRTVIDHSVPLLINGTPPDSFKLLPNFPNPFNPETWMPFHLADDTSVRLSIHDAMGRLVRVLDLGRLPAGRYETRNRAAYWDGRNDAGEAVASGTYFYQLQASGYSETRAMIILK